MDTGPPEDTGKPPESDADEDNGHGNDEEDPAVDPPVAPPLSLGGTIETVPDLEPSFAGPEFDLTSVESGLISEDSGWNNRRIVAQSGSSGAAAHLVQGGSSNLVTVRQIADQSRVTVRQLAAFNVATFEQIGTGNAALTEQVSSGNAATLMQRSNGDYALIYQRGIRNQAAGYQIGSNQRLSIYQRGQSNFAEIRQGVGENLGAWNIAEVKQDSWASATVLQQGMGVNEHPSRVSIDQGRASFMSHAVAIQRASAGASSNLDSVATGRPSEEFFFSGGARSAEIVIIQTGMNSSATVEQHGRGQYARIEQGPGRGNEASILQLEAALNATAVIRQTGSGNTYHVVQDQPNQYVLIKQTGTGNAVTNIVN